MFLLFHVRAARVVLGHASLIAFRRRRLALIRKLGSWESGSCKSASVLSVHASLRSAPPVSRGHAVRIRVLAGRLVDDPVMMAASLRLGTTIVRTIIPAGYRLDACFL